LSISFFYFSQTRDSGKRRFSRITFRVRASIQHLSQAQTALSACAYGYFPATSVEDDDGDEMDSI
jgi:hypothetical protein